jgi:hypothetical protein
MSSVLASRPCPVWSEHERLISSLFRAGPFGGQTRLGLLLSHLEYSAAGPFRL